MKGGQQKRSAGANSMLVLFAFVGSLLFQITVLKHIWQMELLSRISNSATILLFSAYALSQLIEVQLGPRMVKFYLLPGVLIFVGAFINITRGVISNPSLINQYGLMVPWAVYLAVPFLVRQGQLNLAGLWRYYSNFMLAAAGLSLVEYYLVFEGLITARSILTSGGYFLAGMFSIWHVNDSGEIHYRLYSAFLEPGTLAMFLLPAMAYACFHRRIFALVLYAVSMYMTDSLGGFIGVGMLILLVLPIAFTRSQLLSVVLLVTLAFVAFSTFGENLSDRYDNKGLSATTREENVIMGLRNLPNLVVTFPFGLPITESTEKATESSAFYGYNFAPLSAFYLGGILAMAGYLMVLIVSMWYAASSFLRQDISIDERVAIVSLICLFPFVVQRSVIWDCNLFSLLFAPFILLFLQANHGAYNRPILFQRSRLRMSPRISPKHGRHV